VQTFTTDTSGQIDATGPFFQSIGTNSRSCNTCHQEGDGWGVSAAHVQVRFNASTSGLTDPIFRAVDGANCNHDAANNPVDLSTPAARTSAFTLLTQHGLIRIPLSVPAGAEFTVDSVSSPNACNEKSPLSTYRRPLPTANLRFLNNLMWDGRESSPLTGTQDITKATNPGDLQTDLLHQSVSATRNHAEAASDPTTDQQQAIANFQMQLSVAQGIDSVAGSLQADGSTGGPSTLATQPSTLGSNDPSLPPLNSIVFTLFNPWANFSTSTAAGARKASIARGQALFNTRAFTISGVPGLTDAPGVASSFVGTCSSCHNAPNVGNRSVAGPINIGVSNAFVPGLSVGYLPVITLRNIANTTLTVQTTDPGLALIIGKWADIGKMKVPILRGLAARAPYFHNGAAQSLTDVLAFYDFRFGVLFLGQDQTDILAFLNSL
jgi:cytochrome c peroxidase